MLQIEALTDHQLDTSGVSIVEMTLGVPELCTPEELVPDFTAVSPEVSPNILDKVRPRKLLSYISACHDMKLRRCDNLTLSTYDEVTYALQVNKAVLRKADRKASDGTVDQTTLLRQAKTDVLRGNPFTLWDENARKLQNSLESVAMDALRQRLRPGIVTELLPYQKQAIVMAKNLLASRVELAA